MSKELITILIEAIRSVGNETVTTLAGDLIALNLLGLRAQLQELIESGCGRITLDFDRVVMGDSAGLVLLVSAQDSLMKSAGRLAVVRPSNSIHELFRSMRLQHHFVISND